MTTNSAFIVSNADITPQNYQPGFESEFLIEFTPEHMIELGGGILINYPPQITPSSSETIKVEISVTGRVIKQSEIYMAPDLSARALFVANII